VIAASLAALALPGCTHLGPRTVTADRVDYSNAVADSWKEQMLLNVVKLRYADAPVFVDVASIVSGYSLETNVTLGTDIFPSLNTERVGVGALGRFIDRPTITFVPMTGDRFLHGMLTPINPKNIFFLVQAGYPADFILGLTVDSLNGVRNRSATQQADPKFHQALALVREVQASGALEMRVEEGKDKREVARLYFRQQDMAPEIAAKSADVRRLLGLPADRDNFTLIYSAVRGADGELAVSSRSMIQIMTTFASYIDVPAEHVANQSATKSIEPPGESVRDPVKIHSGKDKPADAFAAVRYNDHWFWIANNDWRSKRALSVLMFFFTLTESGGEQKLPLITIPAQ
jgi:hypothetical protein